ncbi:MAG: acyl-CoA dehydrogenase family protein [Pseudomonadota bacterium]
MTQTAQLLSNRIDFTDEQALLFDTAADFVRSHSPVARVRELLEDERGYDPARWQEMVELGWLGVAIPEEHGGSGLGAGAVVAIAEPLGRGLVGTPFATTQMVVQALLAGGTDAQRARWLPRIAAGAAATVALTEADGDWDLSAAGTRLDGGVVSGRKTLVTDAPHAEMLLVSGTHDGQPALALVPGSSVAADALAREVVLDETRRSYSVAFENVAIEDDALLTGPAAAAALTAIDRCAWLLWSADACGGVHSVIDLLVDYLNTRKQFGRPIGSYQALKHPSVDILMSLERARSHLYHAASLLDAGENAEIALRMAKAESGEAYVHAGDRAIQFHGGFGFTYECDAQLYLRRALWLNAQYGDAPAHRRALEGLLLD